MKPRLIAFSDLASFPDCEKQLRALCLEAQPETVALVVRDRERRVEERTALARGLSEGAEEGRQFLLMSGSPIDIPRDGVHVSTDQELPSGERWLSRAWHGLRDWDDGALCRLTATLISPVWAPRKGREPLGADGLRLAVTELKERRPELLCYALGGVTADNAALSLKTGADGVAAIGAVMNPTGRRALLSALQIAR